MDFGPPLVAFILVGLFSIALISAGVLIAANNSPNQTIANNPALTQYATSITPQISNAYVNGNSSKNSLGTTTISTGVGGIILDAISGIWKGLEFGPIAIYNLVIGLIIGTIFTGAEYVVVFTALGAIIILGGILAVWKLVWTGQSGEGVG
jgi:hypothetical protein